MISRTWCRYNNYMKHTLPIESNPDILSGGVVFAGTRVPVRTLMEYLEAGRTIDDFLEGFPTVRREQVIAFLEQATEQYLASIRAA